MPQNSVFLKKSLAAFRRRVKKEKITHHREHREHGGNMYLKITDKNAHPLKGSVGLFPKKVSNSLLDSKFSVISVCSVVRLKKTPAGRRRGFAGRLLNFVGGHILTTFAA
jgi:hypothetical protein